MLLANGRSKSRPSFEIVVTPSINDILIVACRTVSFSINESTTLYVPLSGLLQWIMLESQLMEVVVGNLSSFVAAILLLRFDVVVAGTKALYPVCTENTEPLFFF